MRALFFAALTCACTNVFAISASLEADFGTAATNPNGNWTYGYFPTTLGVGFTPYTIRWETTTIGWLAPQSNNQLGTPSLWKNLTDHSEYGVGPGQVSQHPGPSELSVSRFVVPASWGEGVLDLIGFFGPGDSGTVQGTVLYNSTVLYNKRVTDQWEHFGFTSMNIQPGDTFDFVVGNDGSFFSDNTPVGAYFEFNPVPEPASMLAMGVGLAAILRKSRKSR
ncbi:MAG: PEP-CTERM sorting domain-containing protein [Armatimonadetes bacterium]|nr:PEP-CTERM sorting domain-containing protein [Armatimonadota bacterium]